MKKLILLSPLFFQVAFAGANLLDDLTLDYQVDKAYSNWTSLNDLGLETPNTIIAGSFTTDSNITDPQVYFETGGSSGLSIVVLNSNLTVQAGNLDQDVDFLIPILPQQTYSFVFQVSKAQDLLRFYLAELSTPYDLNTLNSILYEDLNFFDSDWDGGAGMAVCGGISYIHGGFLASETEFNGICGDVFVFADEPNLNTPLFACTDPNSLNFDPNAEADDGTCLVCNSQNLQNCSETGCQSEDGFWDASQNLCRANTLGCTDPAAENFDENATVSDSSACIYCTAENPESCWTAESCENVGGVWYSESNICGTAFDDSSTSKNLPDTENSVFIDDPVSAGYHQTFQLKCERYKENFDCDNWRFDISEEFLTFGIDSIYKILLYFFGFILLFGFSVWILRGIYKITFN